MELKKLLSEGRFKLTDGAVVKTLIVLFSPKVFKLKLS